MRFMIFVAMGLGVAGCAPKDDVYPWTELPQAAPKWASLAGPGFSANEQQNPRPIRLASGTTEGLFPASIAIARVVGVGGTDEKSVVVQLAEQPSKEFVDWMELFDDYWQISDVMPLDYPGLRTHTGRAADFVVRAADVGADLCLVYTIDLFNPECEIRGALYTTFDGRLLATVKSDAEVDLPIDEDDYPAPPEGRTKSDWRHIDPYFIALDSFRENLRQCVRSLIERDKPVNAPTASAIFEIQPKSSPTLTVDR